jgi:hypothetical protein
VNADLADARYLGDRRFEAVSPLYERALETVELQAKIVRDFKTSAVNDKDKDKDTDNQIREKLLGRYDRARLNLKVRLAYLWAQGGVNWLSAQRYAEDNYDRLKKGDIPLISCLDDYETFNILDTYAYVKLSLQAHNFQTDRTQPDPMQVREGRWILEEAIARLRRHDADEPSAYGELFCSDDARTKLWVLRMSSHLRLAESMLR